MQNSSSVMMSESNRGMREMCLNILMEAEEKCEEIDVKCEEEYRYLKFKEIVEQRSKVKTALEKRKHEVNREFRVFMTKLSNISRLAQLKAKNDIVKQIMDEVKLNMRKDSGFNSRKLLQRSMVQALFMLMEPEVKVICRKKDKDLLSSCFRDAVVEYEKATLLHVKICIAKETLPEKSGGGFIVCNTNEDVSVDCQFDSRVEQVCRLAMPLIVDMLFADVKLADVVRESPTSVQDKFANDSIVTSSAKSVQILQPIDDDDMRRMERSQVPMREQGVHSSTIALPVGSPSPSSRSPSITTQTPTSDYEREPSTERTRPGDEASMNTASPSMNTASPSPTHDLRSVSQTPSMSPSPPLPNFKDNQTPQKPPK